VGEVIGCRVVYDNDEPLSPVNQTKVRCGECDQGVTLTWNEGETPSKTAESVVRGFREEHERHARYAEALPVLGKQVPLSSAPAPGSTHFDRFKLSALPSPPDSSPPTPGDEAGGGGGGSPFSHYPGF